VHIRIAVFTPRVLGIMTPSIGAPASLLISAAIVAFGGAAYAYVSLVVLRDVYGRLFGGSAIVTMVALYAGHVTTALRG
jgi:hypothetical protein